jgi:hypothetical protein
MPSSRRTIGTAQQSVKAKAGLTDCVDKNQSTRRPRLRGKQGQSGISHRFSRLQPWSTCLGRTTNGRDVLKPLTSGWVFSTSDVRATNEIFDLPVALG